MRRGRRDRSNTPSPRRLGYFALAQLGHSAGFLVQSTCFPLTTQKECRSGDFFTVVTPSTQLAQGPLPLGALAQPTKPTARTRTADSLSRVVMIFLLFNPSPLHGSSKARSRPILARGRRSLKWKIVAGKSSLHRDFPQRVFQL